MVTDFVSVVEGYLGLINTNKTGKLKTGERESERQITNQILTTIVQSMNKIETIATEGKHLSN